MHSLQSQMDFSPLYFLPNDPLAEEVLIPGFRAAEKVDCMAGFFSSSVLADLAPGLAAYIARPNHCLRLIISPFLRPEDHDAMEKGSRAVKDVASEAIEEIIVTQDFLEQHTLQCLSYLLQKGRIEIKIALMKDALFHAKVWIFQQGEQTVSAHGSSNLTYAGIRKNFEQVSISRSWHDSDQRYAVKKFQEQFERLWRDQEDNCAVVSIPQAVEKKIIKNYPSSTPPTEEDFQDLYNKVQGLSNGEQEPFELPAVSNPTFDVPEWLKYEEGDFEHQGKAVEAWCQAGHQGVLEMATGSGKTITAMICAHRLYKEQKPLLIVVAAPYVPLVQQWCEEITPFGLRPANLTEAGGPRGRAMELNRIKRSFRNNSSDVEVVVVSHNTLCDARFKSELEKFNCAKLLIADEAHNLGSEGFIGDPPLFFGYRLGLSATPVRQYDEDGTASLFAFFGDKVFEFTLKEAIGRCLVEYDYYVHPVELTLGEMDDWREITAKIKANSWRQNNGNPDDYLAKLFRDRRILLETANNKIDALEKALSQEEQSKLKHTLIYASDKAPTQLEKVNNLLKERGILFHQLTYKETAKRDETARLIKSFQDGTLRILTAMRVLDEGINIPQIQKAFILASTTVERQWVQRRGRLLRACHETGKTYSEIHDFIALPPEIENIDDEARSMVRSELLRVQEFASLARNAGKRDGPLRIIDKMVRAAFM